jgi:hypothetical protein
MQHAFVFDAACRQSIAIDDRHDYRNGNERRDAHGEPLRDSPGLLPAATIVLKKRCISRLTRSEKEVESEHPWIMSKEGKLFVVNLPRIQGNLSTPCDI